MKKIKLKHLIISLLLIVFIVLSTSQFVVAQAPIGNEFQVNTYTLNDQSKSSIAMSDDGKFVITWESSGQDSSGFGIYAQRFDSSGVALGAEFQVNTYTQNSQSNPDITMNSNGDFVITWESYVQDSSGSGIYAQRFDNNGNLQGSEFKINTYTLDNQHSPKIAMNDNGHFIIIWISGTQNGNSSGVYAQRFDNNGIPQGNEFQVISVSKLDVVMDNNGGFIIIGNRPDGNTVDVYTQRYNNNNVPLGNEFRVNTNILGNQGSPSIAMDDNNDFIITWQDDWLDGDLDGVFAKRYNSNGTPKGTDFQVNTSTQGEQGAPHIAMRNNGNFMITWTSSTVQGVGIFGQQYDNIGQAVGAEFRIDSQNFTWNGISSSAINNDNGNFVVTWTNGSQDGNKDGIFAIRYNPMIVSSTEESLKDKINIQIYPNPVQSELTIVLPFLIKGNVVISNQLGQIVKTFSLQNERSFLDVTNLKKGNYTIAITFENGEKVTKQFIK